MNAQRPLLFLWGVLLLGTAASLVLLLQAFDEKPAPSSIAFQRLVGGLGMGPALDLSQCPYCFDPRISTICRHDMQPIPGGSHFCPQHACSIFYYPMLPAHTPEDEP